MLKDYLEGGAHSLFLPDLPHYPAQAMAMLEQNATEHANQSLGFVGSSLGGYYATWLAEKFNAPAVLINPAVQPYHLLGQGLGENQNYHTGETYQLTQTHLDQLLALEVDVMQHPEKLLLLTQTGDEVLDYRAGVVRYQGAEQVVIEGGDHGFSNYADYLPQTVQFLERHQTA